MSIFRSLRHYNYRLFFTGQAISLIGTWMQRVAISWLVYRLTGSAFLLGLITFLSLIPSLILAPYAGSYVDRHNKFKILVITQIILMLQAGALAVMIWFKVYDMFWIAALSLVQGLINAFDVTARQSLMVNLIDDKEDLPNAIALNSSMFNAARLIGPALAGVILSTLGEDICFLINFVSFIAVIGCLAMMKLKLTAQVKSKENIWIDLKKGYEYLKTSPDLSSMILMMAASSLLVIPFTTLLPVFAKDIFNGDATTFGWFESAAGFGAFFGAIYMATRKAGQNLQKIVIVSGGLLALAVIALSIAPTLILALVCTGLAALGLMAQTSSINTYLQTHADDLMRGRTLSYYIMAYQGVLPVGSLLMGFLAHEYGTQVIVAFEGIAGLLIVGAFLYHEKHRNQLENKLSFFG
ncbi:MULTISPECIES: MFS transporter [unclassified Pedobacter]|uniref:MFS transporter n=1 Tax=unclassified Pedobacter TaxID=2628915 RepID=UPI000B4BC61D|nr:MULTISPECIES: MFS transporter [unclassified Pedobacter]MCX2430055.1 MFS transporter [Pedobacter sp. GR22-10]MCX2586256.1 MFS transporter [Pedobacter sp. MR22-3]OWK69305.1 MFS transporter [Pedobacter sp. AJM]